MTRLASRSALNVVLALAVLVLALTTAFAPDTAVAKPPAGSSAHDRPPAPKAQVRRHVEKRLSRGVRAVQIANRLTGTPYVWGGASPRTGFDCSGLVQYV